MYEELAVRHSSTVRTEYTGGQSGDKIQEQENKG